MLSGYFSGSDQQVAAILAPNSIEFVVSYLAIVHTGHIALCLDPAYKKLELDAIIDQIPSKFIITTKDYRRQISDHHEPVILAENLLAADSPTETVDYLRQPADGQIASLTFTSGTTGRPKVVPNTHANHIWNIQTCSKIWDWTSDDSLLISVPLSHMLGIVMGLSGVIYHGNTFYLQRWFDEAATLKLLSSGKISFFSHAAAAYIKLAQMPDEGYDLSKVRLCVSGAAPLPPAIWQELKKRYGIEIVETYGTSETGRIAGNQLHERTLGSPGRPLPGVNIKLDDNSELLVKSGGVFPGYYHNPGATRAGRTSDGYWRTGDIAELRDGFIILKGRLQERIRRYGYDVSPRDVEWALLKNPRIQDAFVMGVQHADEPTDELVYFIVSDLSDDRIHDYCKHNLVYSWRPSKLIRLEELPRTRSGKPQLSRLKELAASP